MKLTPGNIIENSFVPAKYSKNKILNKLVIASYHQSKTLTTHTSRGTKIFTNLPAEAISFCCSSCSPFVKI